MSNAIPDQFRIRTRAYFDLLWTQLWSNCRPLSFMERIFMSKAIPDQFRMRSNSLQPDPRTHRPANLHHTGQQINRFNFP